MITRDQNLALMRAATLEEVEEIVKGMKKNKALGLDGFTVEFYQVGWKFLGQDILDVVEESRRNQEVCPGLNLTLWSLIRKNGKSKNAQGFRPIALCNREPLSPFLFIIAAEGVGRYIKKELWERKIKGPQIWGNNLPITHQQFVDDIMLFCTVSLREVETIKWLLDLFMEASSTQINKEKSCTFFFNTTSNVQTYLTRILGFRSGDLPTKYLGTPLALNPLKMVNWQQTIEKLKNRLENWSFRTLNIAGRAVLLKVVLQAIPIYPLSKMTTPKGACAKMVEIFRKFLWRRPKKQNKWALISWKGLIKSK
eukprot:PITA_08253